MYIDKKAIGKRIRNIRLMLGYTMAEFGILVGGANQSLVARWENGTSLPKADRIAILMNISGLTEDSLLYGIKPYTLPEHIERKIMEPGIHKFLEVEEYETYLALSGEEDSVATLHHFQEIRLIAKFYKDKEKVDYLYNLEQQTLLKTNEPQLNIECDLKDVLSSSIVVGFDNKALTEEQKNLILNILTPLVQYFD